jgi:hypothetical protein
MKIAMGILLVAAMILSSGCFEMPSVYPLFTDQTAIAEPRLEGTWQVKDEKDKEYMFIMLSGDRAYHLTYVDEDGQVSGWEVRIGKLDGVTIADMVRIQDEDYLPAHHFLALSFEKSVLKTWFLDSSALREQAAKEGLAYVRTNKNKTILTAPTASLAGFLKKSVADEMKKDPDQTFLRLK